MNFPDLRNQDIREDSVFPIIENTSILPLKFSMQIYLQLHLHFKSSLLRFKLIASFRKSIDYEYSQT